MEVWWYLTHIFFFFVLLGFFASLVRWRNLGAAPSVLVNSGSNRTGCSRWARRPPAPTAPSGEAPSDLSSFCSMIYLFFSPVPPLLLHLRAVLRGQEGPRGGQEMPQSVRSGAQGPVVHRLPLEESLSALPRLKPASVRPKPGWMNECKRLLSWRGYKSGLESHKQPFSCVFVLLWTRFFFFCLFFLS